MPEQKSTLTYKRIFLFWTPLAATWLMMATEGPFLAAIIARLADPKYNLAAYGVAFSFAVLIEAPIIMLMSASTALVKDRDSYLKLRNFTFALNAIVTLIMILFLIPQVFTFVTQDLIGLPDIVARLVYKAIILMLPWPGAIGYRRFYQGILIRSNLTRRVAYGTGIRLVTMTIVAIFCYLYTNMEGAVVGALSLAVAVSTEAIASRLMAYTSVKTLVTISPEISQADKLSYRFITKFYYPLALTSILGLGIHPMVTFFMGQSRMALESLAALPVINSLVFIFRSLGLSYQEVGIALMGEKNEHYKKIRNFALILASCVVGGLALLVFTPLSFLWFQQISGLSLELTLFSMLPAKLMVLMPGLTVLISMQRAILVNNKKTTPITIATAIEVFSIFCVLSLTIHILGLIGAIGAALAVVSGRSLANVYLITPSYRTLSTK